MIKRCCVRRRCVFYKVLTRDIQIASALSPPRNQAAYKIHNKKTLLLFNVLPFPPALYSNICKSNAALANNQENVRC